MKKRQRRDKIPHDDWNSLVDLYNKFDVPSPVQLGPGAVSFQDDSLLYGYIAMALKPWSVLTIDTTQDGPSTQTILRSTPIVKVRPAGNLEAIKSHSVLFTNGHYEKTSTSAGTVPIAILMHGKPYRLRTLSGSIAIGDRIACSTSGSSDDKTALNPATVNTRKQFVCLSPVITHATAPSIWVALALPEFHHRALCVLNATFTSTPATFEVKNVVGLDAYPPTVSPSDTLVVQNRYSWEKGTINYPMEIAYDSTNNQWFPVQMRCPA